MLVRYRLDPHATALDVDVAGGAVAGPLDHARRSWRWRPSGHDGSRGGDARRDLDRCQSGDLSCAGTALV